MRPLMLTSYPGSRNVGDALQTLALSRTLGSEAGLPAGALFSIGDKVKFVKARAVGASIEFKTMEGKITDFSKPKGLRALIKYHGGNYVWKKLTDIRRLDQPSPLNGIIGMDNA